MTENPSNTHRMNNQEPPIVGQVVQVTGTVVDVQFPRNSAPNILNELHIIFDESSNQRASIEVAQQLGDGLVRCIAIENIYGIKRGLQVIDTGAPISVPVGKEVLGRIFNVLG